MARAVAFPSHPQASDGEVLPVLLLAGGEHHLAAGHLQQRLVGLLLQRVVLQVEALESRQAGLQGVHLDLGDEVLAGVDGEQGGDVEEDGGQLDEGVAGDVQPLQRRASAQLRWQL